MVKRKKKIKLITGEIIYAKGFLPTLFGYEVKYRKYKKRKKKEND